MKARTITYTLVLFLKCIDAFDYTTKDCPPGDGLTLHGTYALFNDSSPNYIPCRVESNMGLPRDVDYIIEVSFQTVGDSMPGIIYNIQGHFDYDMVFFRTNNYNCLIFASFDDGIYTKHETKYCSITIDPGERFQVKLHIKQSSIEVSINTHDAIGYSTQIDRRPSIGFIQGLGYKRNCDFNCQYYFQELKFGPETEPDIRDAAKGILERPEDILEDTLYVHRLEFQHIGYIPGTYCFVAFFNEYINIGDSAIYIQDISDHEQGDVEMYSTPSVYQDIYFYSGNNQQSYGYRIRYHVFACGIPENDLSFICERGMHTELGFDYFRSTSFMSDPQAYNSDHDLDMGWYRFTSCAGNRMPTVSPEIQNVCGTRDPIWLQNISMTPGPEKIYKQRACMYQGVGMECGTNWIIPVFQCPPDRLLYYLVPTSQDSAYCAGDKVVCNTANETSIEGTGCSPCVNNSEIPTQAAPPTLGEWTPTGNNSHLPCLIQIAYTPIKVLYEIVWWVEYGTHRDNISTVNNTDDITPHLLLTELTASHLQNHVYCRVRARYDFGDSLGYFGQAEVSDMKFIGLKFDERSKNTNITVAPETYRTLEFEFTLPINCASGTCIDPDNNCYVDVFSVTTTRGLTQQPCKNSLFVESIPIHEHGCSVRVLCSQWKQSNAYSHFTVAGQDTKQVGRPSYKHTTYLVTKDRRPMWNNLVVQTSITVIPEDRLSSASKRQCSTRSDPHVNTFNSCAYQLQRPGEYVFYKSTPKDDPTMEVLVTTRLRSCTIFSEHCSDALGVRVKNEAVVINFKDSPSHRYMGPGYGEDGFKLTASHNFRQYTIYLPKGEEIRASRISKKDLSFSIQSPGEKDTEKSNGLCGNIGWTETKNDLFDRNGKLADGVSCRSSQHISSILSQDWKVFPNETIIGRENIISNNASNSIDTFQCTVFDINEFLEAEDWTFDRRLIVEPCIPHRPSNMMDQLRADSLRSGPQKRIQKRSKAEPIAVAAETRTEWDNATATQYCQDYILGSAAARSCASINPSEIDKAVDECALDIVLSGETTWAIDTLNSMRQTCLENLYRNLSFWDFENIGNETICKLPTELTEDLCPDECSGNGTCIDGECICDPGFIGFDCAMKEETPPELYQIFEGEVCYVDECDKIRVQGDNFVDSDNLTCHFTVEDEITQLNASMWNYDMVSCTHPPFNTTADGYLTYLLKVSNDGLHLSGALKVILVDSACLACELQGGENAQCDIRTNKCLIEDECVEEGSTSPADVCLICDPTQTQSSWTKVQGCGDKEPDVPEDKDDGMPALHVGLISVACVIALIGTVVMSAFVLRSSKFTYIVNKKKKNTAVNTEIEMKEDGFTNDAANL